MHLGFDDGAATEILNLPTVALRSYAWAS